MYCLDFAAEFAVSGNLAEDVAHRDMDPIGKLPEHGPLCALAAAGHSEEDYRAISMTFFHDLDPLARVERPECVYDAGELENGAQACPASVAVSTVGLEEKSAGETGSGRTGIRHATPPSSGTSKARSKPLQGTRVLLARHAETAAPDRFHGAESDIGLSELGFRQAERLADFLKTTGAAAVYSSAMRRAVDTALPIARACKLVPVPIAALHERRIGPLSGLSREDGWAVYAASKARWISWRPRPHPRRRRIIRRRAPANRSDPARAGGSSTPVKRSS